MNLKQRTATPEDREFLAEMLEAAMNWNRAGDGLSRAQLEAMPKIWHYIDGWQHSTDFGLIAEHDGVAVGAAWARFFTAADPGYGYVRDDVPELSMGVAAGYRGHGIGGLLLDALIAECRQRGIDGLSLSVEDGNAPARALYEGRGFAVVGRVGNSDTLLLEL